jgi:hypothetical protein
MKGLRSPRGRGFRKILRCHFGEWLKWDEERFEDESHSESNSGSRGDRRNVSHRPGRVRRKQRGRRQGQGLLPELQAGGRRPVGRARQEIHRQDRRAGEGADGRLGHLSSRRSSPSSPRATRRRSSRSTDRSATRTGRATLPTSRTPASTTSSITRTSR